MLAVLLAGEGAPRRLVLLALGKLRRTLPQPDFALAGHGTVHPVRCITGAVDLMGLLEQQIADLDQPIGVWVAPLQSPLAPLDSIPGVDSITTREIIAASGQGMRRCGSAGR